MRKLFFSFLLVIIVLSDSAVLAAEYIIQPGDSLSVVASKVGHTVDELCIMNKISPNKILRPGDKIVHITKADRESACQYWARRWHELTKVDDNKTEIDLLYMLTEIVCADLLSERIYYDKSLERHTHFSYVFPENQ